MNTFIKERKNDVPKIIENIREKLLEEARRQVMENGYSAMTIRSVASACKAGVGTVYNYFESKDMLVASFMLEDWFICKSAIDTGCKAVAEPRKALECMYNELHKFIDKYSPIFKDESAGQSSSLSFKQRHEMLRGQLAEPVLNLCERQNKADAAFLAEFVAESLLTWTMEGYDFEKISSVLIQLF